MDDQMHDDLVPPDPDDDEAMVEFGRQIAMDGLLRDVFGDLDEKQARKADELASQREVRKNPSKRRRYAVAFAVAASLLVALIVWRMNSGETAAEWQIHASDDAQFRMIEPNMIELTSGELVVDSDNRPAPTLTVMTPNSQFVSDGAKCVIGAHQINATLKEGGSSMIRQLTRVLVLTGLATLSNDFGSIEAHADELVQTIDNDAPVSMTVKYNTQFGIDLYRQIASNNESENMFLSPFSVSSALAMLAEGARGQTALELGNVLHFPAIARRSGDDAQFMPWETAKIYAGISSLNEILDRANQTPRQVRLSKKVDALRQQLRELRDGMKDSEKPAEYQQLEAKERTLWSEYRSLIASRRKHSKGSDEYERLTKVITEKRKQRSDVQKEKSKLRDTLYREIVEPLIRKEQSLVAQINSALKSLNGYDLRVANAIWAEKSHPFEQSYVDAVSEAFRTGGLIPAGFRNQPQAERERINRWIEEHTNHLIQDFLPADAVDRSTGMILANAIYFRGEWKSPFNPRSTRMRNFTLADGSEIKTPMMRQSLIKDCLYAAVNGDGSIFDTPREYDANNKPQLYPDETGFHMVSLPYSGDDISMVLIAPMSHNGLGRLEGLLTDQRLKEWLASLSKRTTSVLMPKFKLSKSYGLVKILRELGLHSAFIRATEPGGADFTGISNPSSLRDRLFVSQILHKSFIEVNEQGTEAAAATGIKKDAESAPVRIIKLIPYFKADRPFLFLIRDDETGAILFMGRIVAPTGMTTNS